MQFCLCSDNKYAYIILICLLHVIRNNIWVSVYICTFTLEYLILEPSIYYLTDFNIWIWVAGALNTRVTMQYVDSDLAGMAKWLCNQPIHERKLVDVAHHFARIMVNRWHFFPCLYIWSRELRCMQHNRHYTDVINSAMASQITGVPIVCSTVCSGADQENVKAPRHWPLWGESTGDRWIQLTKGQ